MSLPAQNPAPQVVAAAGQTIFPFAWRCDDAATVVVWVNDVQVGGSGVALNADQTAAPGGNITLAAPAALNDVVTIERQNPQTQTVALTAYFPFTAVALTAALDRIVETLQEFWSKLSRAAVVKRSVLPKVSSFELPVPAIPPPFTPASAIGWRTDDAGAHWYLDNISVDNVIVPGVGVLVKNEVPVGAISSTDGSDGNGVFTFAHAAISAQYFDIIVDGVRQPKTRYVRVGNIVTFNATFKPIVGADVCGDYYY